MLTLLIPCILLAYSSTCWWLGIPNDCNNVTLSNDASLSSSTLVDFTPFSFRHQLALSGNHSARLSLLCKDYLLAYFTTVQTRVLVYSATWIYLSLAGYPPLLGFPIIHPFHAICHIHNCHHIPPHPSLPSTPTSVVVGMCLPRSVISSNVEHVKHLKTTANIT